MNYVADASKPAIRVVSNIVGRHIERDRRIGVENEVGPLGINAPRTVSNQWRPRSTKRATLDQ